jgi:hypothetical protein
MARIAQQAHLDETIPLFMWRFEFFQNRRENGP